MSFLVVSYRVSLCPTMSCCIELGYVMLFYVPLCRIALRCIMFCLVLSIRIVLVVSCLVVLWLIVSRCVVLCRVALYWVVLCRFMSRCVVSYRVVSCCFLQVQILRSTQHLSYNYTASQCVFPFTCLSEEGQSGRTGGKSRILSFDELFQYKYFDTLCFLH